jgi:hypothetical protein
VTRHVGCGTKNPFGRFWINVSCWLPAALSGALVVFTGSWWWELTWLLAVVGLAPMFWWEFVHSPSKMYRTWWP